MSGMRAGQFRIHKAQKVGAHFMLGFEMTSLHGSCGLFNSLWSVQSYIDYRKGKYLCRP